MLILGLLCLLTHATTAQTDTVSVGDPAASRVDSLVTVARKLIGVPYRYGGCTPEGFDCSGFVNYVFNHFGMELPRSSSDMAHIGTEVPIEEACKGDIVLFAGHDPKKRPIGHAGIITSDPGEPLRFIHSATSGRLGVTESMLEGYDYFTKRLVKIVRVAEY